MQQRPAGSRVEQPPPSGVRPAPGHRSARILVLLALLGSSGCGQRTEITPVAPRATPTGSVQGLLGLEVRSDRPAKLWIGETGRRVVAAGRFENGTEREVRPRWETSDESVLVVDEDGALQLRSAGSATVTGTLGARSAAVALEVFRPTPRATTDRPDDRSGPQVHFVYAVPSDGADRGLDRYGYIQTSITVIQEWLAENAGSELRIDTYDGRPDITFVRLAHSTRELLDLGTFLDRIQIAMLGLGRTGSTTGRKIHAVYYGAVGPLPGLAGLSGGPATVSHGTDYPGTDEDAPQSVDLTMIHELFHALGAVASCAPNHGRGAHVVDDPRDIMYSGSERSWGAGARIDEDRDDYFGHDNGDCTDIADSPFWARPPLGR